MVDLTAESAVRVLGNTLPGDALLSADGETAYVATASGQIGVFQVDTGLQLSTWNVGTKVGGFSLSADGRYLAAVEASPVTGVQGQANTLRAYRIDTLTGTIDHYDLATSGEGAFYDTAILANGSILLSQQNQGGNAVTFRTLDPATGMFAAVPGSYKPNSVFSTNADNTRVLVSEPAGATAQTTILEFAPNGTPSVVGTNSTAGTNKGVQAYSADGTLVANYIGTNGILIFDGALQQVRNLKTDFPNWLYTNITGLVFDATASNLYVLDTATKVVIQVSTSTWQEVKRFAIAPDVGVDFLNNTGRFGNNLQLTDDGDYLIVIRPQGVERMDVLGINGTSGDDQLNGTPGEDHIYGLAGNDILDGKDGGDLLVGGAGNDRYYLYSSSDILVEKADQGIDEVRTAFSIYTLADNFENLSLVDPGDHAAAIGNAANNVIRGNVGHDEIYGREGNDTLYDGGGAADALIGGTGNDIYYVDTRFSSTIEAANEGIDEVRTAFAIYGLQANVENLTATDNAIHGALVGNALDNVIKGGTGGDDLFGREGSDTLKGGAGAANTLFGQQGDDIYYADAVGDSIKEQAGEGSDQIYTTLTSFVMPDNVEQLAYIGSGAFVGIGNNQSNVLQGGALADVLSGLGGDDVIIGGSGADDLQGGDGPDQFRYLGGETGIDRIRDFSSGSDKIVLIGAGFAHTTNFEFMQGASTPTPDTGNSTFLYNSSNGIISYDADGFGAAAAVSIAQLNPGLTLSANDFLILV